MEKSIFKLNYFNIDVSFNFRWILLFQVCGGPQHALPVTKTRANEFWWLHFPVNCCLLITLMLSKCFQGTSWQTYNYRLIAKRNYIIEIIVDHLLKIYLQISRTSRVYSNEHCIMRCDFIGILKQLRDSVKVNHQKYEFICVHKLKPDPQECIEHENISSYTVLKSWNQLWMAVINVSLFSLSHTRTHVLAGTHRVLHSVKTRQHKATGYELICYQRL